MNFPFSLPPFDWHRVVVEPWTTDLALRFPVLLMGFLVVTACGWVGTFLVWRRMALVGDAISHSVLPGIVVAFLLSGTRSTLPMFCGALAAGLATSVLIEVIYRRSRVKVDAALGIVFTTMFAAGVIMIAVLADHVDLDADCVLYGEIGYLAQYQHVQLWGISLGPPELLRMAVVTLLLGAVLVGFFKELQLSSFDPGLAHALGINPQIIHYGLMAAVSLTVVSVFEAVGSILVIAMLILPGVTASLLSDRLRNILLLVPVFAALSATAGLHLAIWIDANIGASMVVAGGVLCGAAWVFSPRRGLLRRSFARKPGPPLSATS